MTAWTPISDAPRPDGWLRVDPHASYVVARFRQPLDEDGEPTLAPELSWAHCAYLTASGWMVGTRGFKGTHGYASFPLDEATHFLLLPAPSQPEEGQ